MDRRKPSIRFQSRHSITLKAYLRSAWARPGLFVFQIAKPLVVVSDAEAGRVNEREPLLAWRIRPCRGAPRHSSPDLAVPVLPRTGPFLFGGPQTSAQESRRARECTPCLGKKLPVSESPFPPRTHHERLTAHPASAGEAAQPHTTPGVQNAPLPSGTSCGSLGSVAWGSVMRRSYWTPSIAPRACDDK
jgi:hypothetical protein